MRNIQHSIWKRVPKWLLPTFLLFLLAGMIWGDSHSDARSLSSIEVKERLGTANAVGECVNLSQLFLPLLTGGSATPSDFSVQSPFCLIGVRGYSGTVQVTVLVQDNFDQPVTLSLQNAPSGVTGTFEPETMSDGGESILTLSLADDLSTDTYNLHVQGSAGATQMTSSVSLQVVEPLMLSGTVVFDDDSSVEGAQINARTEDGTALDSRVTNASGEYRVELPVLYLPARVLVEASWTDTNLPTVDNFRWQVFNNYGAQEVERIQMPNPAASEMTLTGGDATTADGSIDMTGLPAEVDRIFGQSYDPDEEADAFPGDFTESNQIPLNSSLFLWMEALDAEGNPVDTFEDAASIRSRVPQSQWGDLEDINAGTDRIDVPIYTFNEETQMWQQMGIGWLEDAAGTILPEDAQSVILDGSFEGEIFSTFETTHLSWMNVDYAYIGPWTLSRLDSSRRNNDCLYNAMQLAKEIALSQAGRTAYAKVNLPNADLGEELSDGNGPELKDTSLPNAYGVYQGDSGGLEDQFKIDSGIWDGCGEGATEAEKKATTFMMAVTILHETAHWKDDVKKHPDDDGDTAGEEGNQLERDLFGGLITQSGGTIERDGRAVSSTQLHQWLDQNNWPPPSNHHTLTLVEPRGDEPNIQISLTLSDTTFELGENIPVEVTYSNLSTSSSIEVLNVVTLEGWPLTFNIINQATGERINYAGLEYKLKLEDSDFTTLTPGEQLTVMAYLVRDPDTNQVQYRLLNTGMYNLTAIYEPFRGVGPATSNTLSFTVTGGGSLTGMLTNANDANLIENATITVMQDGNVLTTATSDSTGTYTIPELPSGSYSLRASAPGFLSSMQDNVIIVSGETTTVNFSLSPLLAQGELRLVLTWGEVPRDLDSHLWLPEEVPYQLYYDREGNLAECPFAELDVDDISSFGPETITIGQRYNTGSYVYAIYNWSGSPDITQSEAKVQVFDSTGLIATFEVPTEGEGPWWHVVTIDGATGSIAEVNQILANSPEPYPDTSSGCNPSE